MGLQKKNQKRILKESSRICETKDMKCAPSRSSVRLFYLVFLPTLELTMAPLPWATKEQSAVLHAYIADFMRRQVEKKLHLFWPTIYGIWFSQFPEQAALSLPLPSDPEPRALTPNEKQKLGNAIENRKNVREFLFLVRRFDAEKNVNSKSRIGTATRGSRSGRPIPRASTAPARWTLCLPRCWTASSPRPTNARAMLSRCSRHVTAKLSELP